MDNIYLLQSLAQAWQEVVAAPSGGEGTECVEQYELWVCFPGWHLVPQRTAESKLLQAEAIH